MRLSILLMAVMMTMMTACAPSKAYVDYTYSEGISWPGGGQQPRVKYLWSLSRVQGIPDGSVVDLMAGSGPHRMEGDFNPDFLQRPHGLFVTDNNILYITDPGAGRVSVVDLTTSISFQIEAFNEVPLVEPIGIVSLPDGKIVISDAGLRLVGLCESDGKFIRFFSGEFERPTGMAVDHARQLIYLSDTWAHTIYRYDFEGNRLGNFGKYGEEPGDFNYPTHLSVDSAGKLYVSDTLNFRIQIFTPEGELVTAFGLPGDIYGKFDKIKGVAIDTEGHIYASDSLLDMVQIFDIQGRLLLFFGQKGSFYGQFRSPAGIFIDSSNRIFVADSLNKRVQAFQFLGGD